MANHWMACFSFLFFSIPHLIVRTLFPRTNVGTGKSVSHRTPAVSGKRLFPSTAAEEEAGEGGVPWGRGRAAVEATELRRGPGTPSTFLTNRGDPPTLRLQAKVRENARRIR